MTAVASPAVRDKAGESRENKVLPHTETDFPLTTPVSIVLGIMPSSLLVRDDSRTRPPKPPTYWRPRRGLHCHRPPHPRVIPRPHRPRPQPPSVPFVRPATHPPRTSPGSSVKDLPRSSFCRVVKSSSLPSPQKGRSYGGSPFRGRPVVVGVSRAAQTGNCSRTVHK